MLLLQASNHFIGRNIVFLFLFLLRTAFNYTDTGVYGLGYLIVMF